jgi:hypothetical protein
MFKKISESSENDPEQLAHKSENSPALSLSETDSGPVESDKVICIGYFVAGYKKNNKFFLHWQNREKCPEVINTFNNRCANLILCNTCIIIIYNNIIQN